MEEFLCSGNQLLYDTTVKLSTNIHHFIHNVPYCIMNTTYSLSIISYSSQQAVIHCNDSITQPTSGFAFANIQSLTLERLLFRGCGGYLKKLDVMKLINSTDSPVHFSQNQSAVLLFLHINTILINEVNITINIMVLLCLPLIHQVHQSIILPFPFLMAQIVLVPVYFCSLPIFLTCSHLPLSKFLSTMQYLRLTMNILTHQLLACLSDLKHNIERLPIANAAGLTVFYTQKKFAAEVIVSQSHFISNYGGAVLVMYFNSLHSHRLLYQVE